MSKPKPNDAPYQINRYPGSEPGTYQFHLVHVPSGRLVTGGYRERSPIAPKYMRDRQAELNTRAVLEPWC
jgi:hypothetical protein